MVDAARPDELLGLLVRQDEIVEQALGQAGAAKRLGEAFADKQRLRGMLQDHGVPGKKRRDDRVDRGEIGIVPGCDDHHHAHRLARDIAPEARLLRRVVGLKRLLGQRHHGARALFGAALLAAIADGPSHLPGKFRGDVVVHRQQGVEKSEHVTPALRDRRGPPLRQGRSRRRQGGVDGGVAGNGSLGIDRAVDRGDDLHAVGHLRLATQDRSKPRFNSQSVTRRSYSNCSHSAL